MKRRARIPLNHPELELPEVRKLWRTEGLFSEHYLKSRVQSNDWWPSNDAVYPLWQFCVDIFNRRYVPCAQNNEAFTRQEMINPILAKLGFAWTDNLSLPNQDAEPDYILFADAAEKEKVIAESREKRYRVASALLEAKKVNHPLSQISKHQQRYPHQQVRDYLQEAQVLGWGILTNGNEWRLYCRDAKPSQFFCISFPLAIKSLENFKYFVSLFSPAAFVRDTAGKCRLDAIRESALAAQTELEADLRQRVFTLVEILANGFVERPENAIRDTPEAHRLLYENCLILLYRLLFILYAEGRLLLPVEPKSRKYYKDLSLARLVGPLKGFTEFDSQTRTRLCEDIVELCHLINGADEAKNKEYSVPRYNGGLFDPDCFPHLERWRICDAKLAEVLRGLMFAKPDRHDRELPLETVDYADLRVQQLGSIYEGLLEHHFARNAAGHLELQTDKSERKATGTYYTPDYIVHYIVEHTLGPLVANIEQRPEVKQGQDNSFADAALGINICDPAMGSGHFLVEATSWLAEQIVYHPTTRFQAEFRHGESQEQTEIAYWRRRVVEACIYGVDLNPLAVELAKLSLWLITIASDQPLNFLDHHLRCGNSLIGARLDDLGKLPERKKKGGLGTPRTAEQTTFIFGPDFKKAAASAIRRIQEIEGVASATVAKVKDKERLWSEISKSLAPYKSVADFWTSTFFGKPPDEETYVAMAQKILAGEAFDNPMAVTRRFFHWELEFPEVFFAADGTPKPNPGFDVVIGNPPYVRPHKLHIDIKAYLWSTFPSYAAKSDLLNCFLEKGLRVVAEDRFVGMITSDTWRILRSSQNLRALILDVSRVHLIRLLPSGVFHDAAITPVIIILQKTQNENYRFGNDVTIISEAPESRVIKCRQLTWMKDPYHTFDVLGIDTLDIKQHIEQLSESLKNLCTIDFGLKTGDDSKFLRFELASTDDKKIITSADVDRYFFEWRGLYVWYRPDLMRDNRQTARPGEPQRFEREKIILSRMAEHLKATVDREGIYVKDAYLLAAPKWGYSLLYLVSLLNSRLLNFWYLSTFTSVDVHLNEVVRLPIHRISFIMPTAERTRLRKKGQELYKSAVKKSDAAMVLKFAEQQLAADHSDVVHDLLVFLAERMMDLNRDKQAIARKFLTDLKDFHGIDAHVLTPKTKLDQFWRLATGDFFTHLRANTKRLAAEGIRLKETDEERLRKRFEAAQRKIVPLETEIAFTDTMMDQIVYRLYGLTEDEIKIVEASAK